MVSGIIAGALALFGGAKRWLNKEMALAIGVTAVAVALLIGGVMLFGAGGSSATAKVNWRWLQQISDANRRKAEAHAAQQARIAVAANEAATRALGDLRAALESKATLESELAKLKSNPEIYSRDERRRLFP